MKRFSKRFIISIAALVCFVTIIVLISFVVSTESEKENRHFTVTNLRNADSLDQELQYQVMRLHGFQLENYDSLAEVNRRLEHLCQALNSRPEALLLHYNDQLPEHLNELCKEISTTVEATEHFKSLNALVRNSVKYIPELISGLHGDSDRSFAFDLYSDILLYCLQPNAEIFDHINEDLARLPEHQNRADNRAILISFEKHAKLSIKAAQERSVVEQVILSGRLKAKVAALVDGYVVASDRLERRSQNFKMATIGSTGILLVVLLVLLYQLQLSADSLRSLNSTLEVKVDQRTSELRNALSELALQQEVVAHATKMSALGEMAGGIAHEINTPLTAISLKAELLLMYDPSDLARKTLNEIITIVEKAAKIVVGLRKFSRTGVDQPMAPYPLRNLIDDTLMLCSEKFRQAGVELNIAPLSADLMIDCVPEQIGQVLLNLLNNAYDAVVPDAVKWVKVDIETYPDTVVIRVTDSGKGIPEAVQAKLMQPFFTTKPIGKGTGIGLSISSGIVAKHGGKLTYDRTSVNTSFKVTLPMKPSAKLAV